MTGTELGVLLEILMGAGIPLRVGLMIATALFLGFFVYEPTSNKSIPMKILIIGVIFIVFEIWIMVSIFNNIEHQLFVPPIITIVLMGGLFLFGISGGMYIAQRADKIRMEAKRRENKVIDEIRMNGKS